MRPLPYLFITAGLLLVIFANSCKKQEYTDPRPNFTTGDTSQVGENTATLTGRLIKLNGGPIDKSGHVWSSLNDVPDLTINEGKTILAGFTADSSSYTSVLNNLQPNKTYYVRGYMERAGFTWYGNIVVFKTNREKVLEVVTGVDSLKTFNSSLLTGYIFDLGKSAVTAYGHVWSTINTNPTTADSKTNFGNLTTVPKYFTSAANNLLPATTYYYKAYGTNAEGTFYGAVKAFITAAAPVPVVTTNTIGGSSNIITINGTLTANGVPAASQHGFVYSKTNTTPTIADSKTSQGVPGAAPFNFMASLGNLDFSSTYYVRAYATNSAGTFYGVVKSFTTSAAPVPVVSTNSISVNFDVITVTGTVTANGTPAATQHGFVYSSTTNLPTIANTHSSQGVPGAAPYNFTTTISHLALSTTYYVRAYVTSAAGTFYGAVLSVTTASPILPSVTTTSLFVNHNTSIESKGSIITEGTFPVTEHGFVYSSSATVPTTANTKVNLGAPATVPINFVSNITMPAFNTTYYIRAYANSAAGTAYGQTLNAKTDPAPPDNPAVVTDSVRQIITYNGFKAFGKVSNNGLPIGTQHGFVYSSTNTAPTINDFKINLGVPPASPTNFSTTVIIGLVTRTYYVRAYITNANGTFYGGIKTVSISQPE